MEPQNEEETLNIQARDIAQRTLLFQAQLRGFLVRNRLRGHVWRLDSGRKNDIEDIYRFSDAVLYEKGDTKTNRISNYNTEKDIHDISKNSVYPLIPSQGGSSGEAKSIDLQTQRPEPVDSLTHHRESENTIFEEQDF